MAIEDRGFASMDDKTKKKVQSMGGKARSKATGSSSSKSSGAAGRTEAAKRGGQNSHR
jgi:hypothetical protein